MTPVSGIPLAFYLATADATAQAAQGPPSSWVEAGTITAMLRSYDPATRTVELITGVGHALRIVHVSLAPESRITRKGAKAAAPDLEAGVIACVRFSQTAKRNLALSIESRDNGGEP